MTLMNILWLVPLLLVPAGLGSKLLRYILPQSAHPLRLFFSYALGLGILSFAIFILGIFHLLYWQVVLGIIILSLLLGLTDIIDLILEIKFKDWLKQIHSHNLLAKFLILSILILFALNLLSSLVPSTDYDDVHHHLAYSKHYAQSHSLEPKYDNWMMAAFPQFMEMHNVYGEIFNNEIVVRLHYFLIYLMLCFLIFTIVNEEISFEPAIWAVAIFVFSESIAHWVRTAHVDIPMAFYSTLALMAIINWKKYKDAGWLYLAIIFSGILVSMKYSGLILLGVNLVLISFIKIRYKNKLSAGQIVFAIALLFTTSAPFYFLSYINLHTILFPFFGDGSFFDKFLDKQVILSEIGPLHKLPDVQVVIKLREIFSLPWNLSVDFKQYGYPIGPILLAFLPAYIFLRKNKKITLFMLYSFAFVFFTYLMRSETLASRFLIPILPLFCVSTAYVIELIRVNNKYFYKIAVVYLLLIIGFNGALIYRQISRTFPFIAGKYNETIYLSETVAHPWGDKLEYIAMFEYINNNFKGKKIKILLDKEIPGYYLDADHYDYAMLSSYKNITFNADTIKKLGITHRLFYSGYWGKRPIHKEASFRKNGINYELIKLIESEGYDCSLYEMGYN